MATTQMYPSPTISRDLAEHKVHDFTFSSINSAATTCIKTISKKALEFAFICKSRAHVVKSLGMGDNWVNGDGKVPPFISAPTMIVIQQLRTNTETPSVSGRDGVLKIYRQEHFIDLQGSFFKNSNNELDLVHFCHDIITFNNLYVVACGKKNAAFGFDLYIYVLEVKGFSNLIDRFGKKVKTADGKFVKKYRLKVIERFMYKNFVSYEIGDKLKKGYKFLRQTFKIQKVTFRNTEPGGDKMHSERFLFY
jgi:hypothetical protein